MHEDMEYDNGDHTRRRPSTSKDETARCRSIPKQCTILAVIVVSLAVISVPLVYSVLSEPKTLRLVIIFFRHGAKIPESSYNSDPYRNYQWKGDSGSLTNTGKLQLYELGKKYRSYYGNFIPEEYYDKDVYVRSSDKSRCMMSAYTFLAGLYPPTESQMWHSDIPWQPIPVHSLPRELDNIVAGTKMCKVWKQMYQELLLEKNADPKFTELFNYLTKHTNESVRSILEVDYLYSALRAQQESNLKLPDWTKNVYPNEMRTPFMLSLALLSYNETMQRYKVGPLFKEMKNAFEDAVNQKKDGRIVYIYSGHDVNVVALWRAFGFQELLEPDYGASIVLELHKDEEQDSFVKVFYRNNTELDVPMQLQLQFCDDSARCPYTKFIQYMDQFIPVDWEAECQNIAQE